MNEQNNGQRNDEKGCGPGCNCGGAGSSTRMKWMVCGVVAVAAAATVAAHVSRVQAEEPTAKQEYALPVTVAAAVAAGTEVPVTDTNDWGAPLETMAELNKVATNTEAVFVVIPSTNAARTEAIQKDVSTAAATIKGRGTKMGTFLLSAASQEYVAVAKQVGAPCVLVMHKTGGMVAVADTEVGQENLLQAFVSASRPTGCGPSGCGPSSSGCK